MAKASSVSIRERHRRSREEEMPNCCPNSLFRFGVGLQPGGTVRACLSGSLQKVLRGYLRNGFHILFEARTLKCCIDHLQGLDSANGVSKDGHKFRPIEPRERARLVRLHWVVGVQAIFQLLPVKEGSEELFKTQVRIRSIRQTWDTIAIQEFTKARWPSRRVEDLTEATDLE